MELRVPIHHWLLAVADPGFPGGGANLLFGQIFAKNCMEKIILLKGGGASLVPPRSGSDWLNQIPTFLLFPLILLFAFKVFFKEDF